MTRQKLSTSRTLAVALAALATTALVACGGGSSDGAASDNAVASLNSTPPGADGSGSGDAAAGDTFDATSDPQEAAAQYEACMKDNGIDMKMTISGEEGVSADDTGGIQEVSSGDAPDLTQGDYDAADKACSKYLDAMMGPQDLTPEQEAAMADADARFKKCIEEQGLDPALFGIGIGDGQPPTDVDTSNMPTNEEIDAAFGACSYIYEDDPKLQELFPSSDTGN